MPKYLSCTHSIKEDYKVSTYTPTVLWESLWQYRLWNFETGVTKLERFMPKNQHTQRKSLNFEFWIKSELSKGAKI